jgi:hypothetical protein
MTLFIGSSNILVTEKNSMLNILGFNVEWNENWKKKDSEEYIYTFPPVKGTEDPHQAFQHNSYISLKNNKIEIVVGNLNTKAIYFYIRNNQWVVTTNISKFKYTNLFIEIDDTGFLQRLVGPDFCTFGERTILKDVKRALPNKKYSITTTGLISEDLSLFYYDVEKLNSNHINSIRDKVFSAHHIFLNKYDKVDVALSGGLDSRITLGVLSDLAQKSNIDLDRISTISYGSYWNYETKIARNLAGNLSIKHQNVWDDAACWPSNKELKFYFENGANMGISSWNNFKRHYDLYAPSHSHCLLMGDLLEAIAGRKLDYGLKRNQKFYRYFFSSPDVQLSEKIGSEITNTFVDKISQNISSWFNLLSKQPPGYIKTSLLHILEQTREDINVTFKTALRYQPITTAQLYEVFQWILYSTPEYRNQTSCLDSVLPAFSPASDQNILAELAKIDPNQRKDGKLLYTILKTLNCYSKLKIPTASSPFMNLNAPDILTKAVRLVRVLGDQNYKRKRMKDKQYWKRTSLLNSVNWVLVHKLFPHQEYKELEGDPVYIKCTETINKRASLTSQPLVNYDIVNNLYVTYLKKQFENPNTTHNNE